MTDGDRHIVVRRDGEDVLDMYDRPGMLVSLSAPPPRPGDEAVTHPFATASFLRPEYEGELGELLREADSLDGFLDDVRDRGYEVVEPD